MAEKGEELKYEYEKVYGKKGFYLGHLAVCKAGFFSLFLKQLKMMTPQY
jgi:hypothetical protein